MRAEELTLGPRDEGGGMSERAVHSRGMPCFLLIAHPSSLIPWSAMC
jgi:hypothetical protein